MCNIWMCRDASSAFLKNALRTHRIVLGSLNSYLCLSKYVLEYPSDNFLGFIIQSVFHYLYNLLHQCSWIPTLVHCQPIQLQLWRSQYCTKFDWCSLPIVLGLFGVRKGESIPFSTILFLFLVHFLFSLSTFFFLWSPPCNPFESCEVSSFHSSVLVMMKYIWLPLIKVFVSQPNKSWPHAREKKGEGHILVY